MARVMPIIKATIMMKAMVRAMMMRMTTTVSTMKIHVRSTTPTIRAMFCR